MKINGDYVVFPYHTPNYTSERLAMVHGWGAAHDRRRFTVDLPDELVENPEKWFEENGCKAFADMVMAMPGKVSKYAGYILDWEHDNKNADKVVDVSTYEGHKVIRILGHCGVFFYLPKVTKDENMD